MNKIVFHKRVTRFESVFFPARGITLKVHFLVDVLHLRGSDDAYGQVLVSAAVVGQVVHGLDFTVAVDPLLQLKTDVDDQDGAADQD